MVSGSPNRSNAVPLDGATVSGTVYVFTRQPENPTRVRFFGDTTDLSGSPWHSESIAPYDFAGGSVDSANGYPSWGFYGGGAHKISAVFDLPNGETRVATASFSVSG